MNLIIPMAGMGKRMRPHTLTIPKPLLPIAGKPIVQRLVEDIAEITGQKIDKVGFIIKEAFGKEIEENLKNIAKEVGSEGHIFYQEEALGTAHAILCAKPLLEGPVIIAFADTLFKADFTLDESKDGIIWTQKVEDPRAFGVVKTNESGDITDFVEKPQKFISDQAIIGIYYLKDGAWAQREMQYLIDNDIKDKGEYQLTNALERMKEQGAKLVPGQVQSWLDCGNKNATVDTNAKYLEFIKDKPGLISESVKKNNVVIIPPVYIGENVELSNSVIGPHVSIGKNSKITDSIIKKAIIQTNTTIEGVSMANSMIGNFVSLKNDLLDLSIGDYSTMGE
ncbi:MAG: sugar phosphate nucleotidyltransferase [Candidatus Cyclobacteriaceae bacterium M2_1C_046]